MKHRARFHLYVVALAFLAAGIAALSSFTAIAEMTASHAKAISCVPIRPDICLPVAPNFEFQPASVDFPAQTVGTTSAPQTVTITNIVSRPITLLDRWEITGDFLVGTNCPTNPYAGMPPRPNEIPVGASCTIEVAFAPRASGARTGNVRVWEGMGVYTIYYDLPLSGLGTPVPSGTLEAAPRSLEFAPQRVSTTSDARLVTISNVGTAPLRLIGISASGDFAIAPACAETLLPGGACPINVWFAPSAAGVRTGALRIESDAPSPVIEVALSGTASAALTNATALWGNAQEPGWGINLNQQDNRIFATLFTYGTDGSALWLFASGLERQPDGSFTGDLFRATSGPPFDRVPWTPITLLREGSMTLRFNVDDSATLTYTVGSVTVVKSLRMHVFGNEVPNCSPGPVSRAAETNYQDLWWNPAESGWGLNLAHQGNLLFASLFTYGDDGRNAWFFASGLGRQPDGSFSGPLYSSTGPSFASVPWGSISVSEVGRMALRFSDGERGVLTYSVNGRTVVKEITRYVFGNTALVCR